LQREDGLFFIVSKIFWLIAAPLNLIALLLILAATALRLWKGAAQRFLYAIIAIFLFFGIFPVGHDALVALEMKYSKPDTLPDKVDGIIVLGGAISAENSLAHGEPVIGANGARLFAFLELARLYPEARLVFTGGSGRLTSQNAKEADYAQTLLGNTGLNTARIIFERNSRNTYENARFSKKLAQPRQSENWILITSAFHMPRSMAVFQGQGWNVIPWPVGYLTDGSYHIYPRSFNVSSQYAFAETAFREYIGSIVYTVTGKMAARPAGDK
jgi:uncharacterized SAM-binding protein YcdF (DUF218 family)